MNISANAPIAAAHEIEIGADTQAVWDALTQIDRWPEWNTDIPKAHLAGPLAVNTVFHWETAGLSIASTIGELIPGQRIGWSGDSGGILGIHVWTLWRTPDGTRVRTEESWEGELPGPIEAVQAALDASLVRWLAALKIRAEPVAR
jgi:uncharacterized protein YndB with AHSA1/START domain